MAKSFILSRALTKYVLNSPRTSDMAEKRHLDGGEEGKDSKRCKSDTMDWVHPLQSSICDFLSFPRANISIEEKLHIRNYLRRAANNKHLHYTSSADDDPLSELLWLWLLCRDGIESSPSLPLSSSSSSLSSFSSFSSSSSLSSSSLSSFSSSSVAVSSLASLVQEIGYDIRWDVKLGFQGDTISDKDWQCSSMACADKSKCKAELVDICLYLSYLLRVLHQLLRPGDALSNKPEQWYRLEAIIARWVRKHTNISAAGIVSNVPVKLLRWSLHAMTELYLLAETMSRARRCTSFSTLALNADVLIQRRQKVVEQIHAQAKRHISMPLSSNFSRCLKRFYCRMLYPAQALQDYKVNNCERVLSRPDEAVSILQHGFTRLDAPSAAVFKLAKRLTDNSECDLKRCVEQDHDALTVLFIFGDIFENDTRLEFFTNYFLFSEDFPNDEQRSRLFDKMSFTDTRHMPLIANFGGKVTVWYEGEYIDCGKDPLLALAIWIVYARDVFFCELLKRERPNLFVQFFNSRFPR